MFTVYISLEFLCNYQAHCSSAYVDTAQIVHCNVLAEKECVSPKTDCNLSILSSISSVIIPTL